MENQIYFDTSLFLYSIALGFSFGLFYELFRFLRLAIPHCNAAVAVEDLLFFLPVTAVFLLFTFAFSEGVVRWFSVFAAAMGFFLYFQTIGKILLFFSDRILRQIRRILGFFLRKTLLPICNVFKNITKYLYTKLKNTAIIIKESAVRHRVLRQKKAALGWARRGFQK